jgi:hypothetical protein
MKRRLLIGSIVVAVAAVVYLETREPGNPESVLARLPTDNAAVLAIDFASLRSGGLLELLSGPTVEEEPEYKTFVAKTGFDYRRDLDHAFVSFHQDGVYFLVRGRFNWKQLASYASEQGGGCRGGTCRMPGSLPARKISFFPLRSNLMAMAVSGDESAVERMREPARGAHPIAILSQPVWLSLPSAALKKSADFPAGTQLFAKAMEDAESVTLSIAPQGRAIEARLEVVCRDAREAGILAAQFQKLTAVLRQIIEQEKQTPNPADLSGVLTAGVFHQEDVRVIGRWPIERAFLDNLAGKAR